MFFSALGPETVYFKETPAIGSEAVHTVASMGRETAAGIVRDPATGVDGALIQAQVQVPKEFQKYSQ